MKLSKFFYLWLILSSLTMSGCDVIGDIFEFGFWPAVIVIILIVLLVVYIIRTLKH